jgi:hypothetical protein
MDTTSLVQVLCPLLTCPLCPHFIAIPPPTTCHCGSQLCSTCVLCACVFYICVSCTRALCVCVEYAVCIRFIRLLCAENVCGCVQKMYAAVRVVLCMHSCILYQSIIKR